MGIEAIRDAAEDFYQARLAFDVVVNVALPVGTRVKFSYGPKRHAVGVVERACHLGTIYVRNDKTHQGSWIDPRRVYEVLL